MKCLDAPAQSKLSKKVRAAVIVTRVSTSDKYSSTDSLGLVDTRPTATQIVIPAVYEYNPKNKRTGQGTHQYLRPISQREAQ